MISHTASFHKEEYKEFLKKEEERKKIKTNANQPKITSFGTQIVQNKYDKNHPKVKGFIKKLIKLIWTISIPISLVEKEEFRELIWYFDSLIPFPNRERIIKEMTKVFEESKQEITIKIKLAKKIVLGADI